MTLDDIAAKTTDPKKLRDIYAAIESASERERRLSGRSLPPTIRSPSGKSPRRPLPSAAPSLSPSPADPTPSDPATTAGPQPGNTCVGNTPAGSVLVCRADSVTPQDTRKPRQHGQTHALRSEHTYDCANLIPRRHRARSCERAPATSTRHLFFAPTVPTPPRPHPPARLCRYTVTPTLSLRGILETFGWLDLRLGLKRRGRGLDWSHFDDFREATELGSRR